MSEKKLSRLAEFTLLAEAEPERLTNPRRVRDPRKRSVEFFKVQWNYVTKSKDILPPRNNKIYGKEPRYNKSSLYIYREDILLIPSIFLPVRDSSGVNCMFLSTA